MVRAYARKSIILSQYIELHSVKQIVPLKAPISRDSFTQSIKMFDNLFTK